ncbi:MAG: CpaD family pilus assembly protein [Rhizobiaceae bacterium]
MVRITKTTHPVAGQRKQSTGTPVRRRIANTSMSLAILLVAGMASGCGYLHDQTVVGTVPDDYRTRHPIVVRESETTQDIIVSVNAKKLSLRDKNLVREIASKYRRAGAREMAVLIPSGSANQAAAQRLAYQATSVLKHNGVPAGNIRILHYQATDLGDAATIRLAFGSTVAEVPSQCGQWQEDLLHTTENRNYYNFGCATQKNLAAMVSNPADLVGPQAESEIDATRRTNVINDWQDEGSGRIAPLF